MITQTKLMFEQPIDLSLAFVDSCALTRMLSQHYTQITALISRAEGFIIPVFQGLLDSLPRLEFGAPLEAIPDVDSAFLFPPAPRRE